VLCRVGTSRPSVGKVGEQRAPVAALFSCLWQLPVWWVDGIHNQIDVFLKWGSSGGKRGHSAEKKTLCRNIRRRKKSGDALLEGVQELNSAAEWEGSCEKGKNWTGDRAAGGRQVRAHCS